MDFLNKIQEIRAPMPEGTQLFSMDVVSLYPNIPQREAAFFNVNKHKITELKEAGIWRPPRRDLVEEAILHVMRDTLLQSEGRVYRQIKGVAIGAPSSVATAEIFMHVAFDKLRTCRHDAPLIYYRYIDDIFGIMTEGD
ncbi:uncharacterized protein [Procambarus clarkii]|uniref:uncharacterized protein n=1 Tax=Procambarus clarkii TaxID=6728 RepID=UPI0037432BF7